MAVAPLQIPSYYAPQAVDFSPLERLGQNLRKSREDDLRRQAIQQYAQTGDARGLFASGDMSLAQLGAQLESRKEAQARDARDFQFRQDEARRAQQNADRTHQLQAQNSGGRDIANQVEQRKRAAAGMGLAPEHPSYLSFVLTGKMPREDAQPLTATDKKAILEADESVLTNKAAITALDEAMKISPKANTGYGASFRATLGNNLPDLLVPDVISSPESSAATANYDNLVLGQALQSLKSIFGAAPTEGERKILIDLQASADKPDHVRQEILARAKRLAEARLSFNQRRADELRGGTFYKQQGGTSNANADALNQARKAIDQGADRNAVIQRLRENGIDPSGL